MATILLARCQHWLLPSGADPSALGPPPPAPWGLEQPELGSARSPSLAALGRDVRGLPSSSVFALASGPSCPFTLGQWCWLLVSLVEDPAFLSVCSMSSACSSAEKRMELRVAHRLLRCCAGAVLYRPVTSDQLLGLGRSGSVYTRRIDRRHNSGIFFCQKAGQTTTHTGGTPGGPFGATRRGPTGLLFPLVLQPLHGERPSLPGCRPLDVGLSLLTPPARL